MKTAIYFWKNFCYNTQAFERDYYSKNSSLCKYAAVAQLDRVPDSDSGGRGFESRQPYQEKPPIRCEIGGFLYFLSHLVFGSETIIQL